MSTTVSRMPSPLRGAWRMAGRDRHGYIAMTTLRRGHFPTYVATGHDIQLLVDMTCNNM